MTSVNKITLILPDKDFKQIDILWMDTRSVGNQISIINYIEENAEDIKKKFCSLINDFIKFNKKIFSTLNCENNYNFFLSSDLYEKSFYKSKEIVNILKLIALKDILKNLKIKKLIIQLNAKKDTECILELCKELKINCKNKGLGKSKYSNIINIKKILYPFITITKFFKFIYLRLSFKNINWKDIKKNNPKNIFFSYSVYSSKNKLLKGDYNSSYWDPLIQNQLVNKSLWINMYFHTKGNSLRKEMQYYENINRKNNFHIIFAEQLIDRKVLFNSIKKYLYIYIKLFFCEKNLNDYLKEKEFFFLKFHFNILFEKSFFGIESIVNIFYYFLFLKLKKKIPFNLKIFYLFENQGWEKTLNFIFSSFKKIAVNHAAIRYWDLRFTNDKSLDEKYSPNLYAVNGKDSFKKLILNNFERKKLINVEALRYHQLCKNIQIKKFNISSILIVSDVHDEGNQNLERLLKNICSRKFINYNFLLKEHVLKKTKFNLDLKLSVTRKKLFELNSKSRVAIASSTTSAVIDLLLMGYEVIVPLNQNTINFSPVRGHENVTFVKEYNQINDILISKLNKFRTSKNTNFENNYFNYNANLESWKKILNES